MEPQSLIKADTLQQFECARRNPSYWHRDADAIEETRRAFLELMNGHGNINLPASVFSHNRASYGIGNVGFPEIIDDELKAMLLTYHQITGAQTMRLEIQNGMEKDDHTHHYAVLNCNWGAPGTGFKTDNGIEHSPEGAWTFTPAGVSHFSFTGQQDLRSTVIIFETEPDLY